MGVFERIRTMSPYFLAAFAVMFILFMVISDMDPTTLMNQGNSPQTAAIAEVNGDEIAYLEFEGLVREQLERQKAQQKESGEEVEIDETAIRSQVYQDLVDLKLSEQLFNKMGLVTNEIVIADQLINNPPQNLRRMFSDSAGQFNRNMYLSVVTNPDKLGDLMGKASAEQKTQFITDFRKDLITMGEQIKLQLIGTMVNVSMNSAGSILSPTYVKEKYIGENSNADITYVRLDVNTVSNDQVKVTDEDLQKYYDEHKEYFKQDAGRKLKYMIFPLKPSKQDTLNAEKKVQKINTALNSATDSIAKMDLFNRFVDEYNGNVSEFTLIKDIDPQAAVYVANATPGTVVGPILSNGETKYYMLNDVRDGENTVVKASHILIEKGANPDSSKAFAEDILKKAKDGANFTELATEFSADKGSAAQGGDLGWFGKNQMVKEFEDAAFAAIVGVPTGIVESQFGYHIILVSDKSTKEVKYSELVIAPKMTGTTKNAIKREAISFYNQVKEGAKFEDIAKKLGMAVTETAYFKQDQTILGNNWVNYFAFNNEVGTVSEVQEFDGYGMVVMAVSGKRDKGIIPFSEKKSDIKLVVTNQKKLDYLKPIAEKIASRVKSGQIDESVKSEYAPAEVATTQIKNNGIINGISAREFTLTNSAFKLNQGGVSKAIRGVKGYYIVQMNNKTMVQNDKVKADFPEYYKTQSKSLENQIFYQWFKDVKDNSNIVDYRAKFYKNY